MCWGRWWRWARCVCVCVCVWCLFLYLCTGGFKNTFLLFLCCVTATEQVTGVTLCPCTALSWIPEVLVLFFFFLFFFYSKCFELCVAQRFDPPSTLRNENGSLYAGRWHHTNKTSSFSMYIRSVCSLNLLSDGTPELIFSLLWFI